MPWARQVAGSRVFFTGTRSPWKVLGGKRLQENRPEGRGCGNSKEAPPCPGDSWPRAQWGGSGVGGERWAALSHSRESRRDRGQTWEAEAQSPARSAGGPTGSAQLTGGLPVVSPGLSGRFHTVSLQPPDHAAAGGCHGLPTPAWPPRGQRAPCRSPPRLGRGAQAAALLTVRDALRQRVTDRTGWGAVPGPSQRPEQPGKEGAAADPPPPTEEGAPESACAPVRPSVQSRHPCLSKALTTTPAPGWPCAVTLLRGCLPGAREGRGQGGGAAACGGHTHAAGAARDPKQDDHAPPMPLPPPLTHLEPKSKLS